MSKAVEELHNIAERVRESNKGTAVERLHTQAEIARSGVIPSSKKTKVRTDDAYQKQLAFNIEQGFKSQFPTEQQYKAYTWQQKWNGKGLSDVQQALLDTGTAQDEKDWLSTWYRTDRGFLDTLSSDEINSIRGGGADYADLTGKYRTAQKAYMDAKTGGKAQEELDALQRDMVSAYNAMTAAKDAKNHSGLEDKRARMNQLQQELTTAIELEGAAYGSSGDPAAIQAELDKLKEEVSREEQIAESLDWAYNRAKNREAEKAFDFHRDSADYAANSRAGSLIVNPTFEEAASGYDGNMVFGNEVQWYLQNKDSFEKLLESGQLKKIGSNAEVLYEKGKYQNWDQMDRNQIEMHDYLLETYGQEAAQDYLKAIAPKLNELAFTQRGEELKQEYNESGTGGKIVMNLQTIPAQFAGNIGAAVSDLSSAATGRFDPYGQGHQGQQYANVVREATSEDILNQVGEEHPVWGQFLANSYQAVMSGLDSALGAALLGNGYTVLMGAGAASERAKELYDAGASGKQIAAGAAASGVLEWLTEEYSIEQFTGKFLSGDRKTLAEWAKNTFIQGFNEASEETASEIGNMILDALINGANSDNSREIRELMNNGLTMEEAERQAVRNRAMDIFWAAYGGFVSGGAMGGAAGAVSGGFNAVKDYNMGTQILASGNAAELTRQAQSLTDERQKAKLTKAAQSVQNENQWIDGRRYKAGKVSSQIARQAAREFRNANTDTFRDAARDYINGNDKIMNKQKALDTVMKKYSDKAFLPGENAYFKMIGGQKLMDAIMDSIGGKDGLSKAAEDRRAKSMRIVLDVDSTQRGVEVSKLTNDPDFTSEDNGIPILKGSNDAVTIDGIARTEGGKLYLNTSAGEVDATDISYGSSGQAGLFSVIANSHMGTELAQDVFADFQASNLDSATYAKAVRNAFIHGRNNADFGSISSASYAAMLDEELRRRIYDAGRKSRSDMAANRQRKLDQGKHPRARSGLIHWDKSTVNMKLNDRQQSAMDIANALSGMGMTVGVYASTEETRKQNIPNGKFYKDGTIWIDLNAGNNGNGLAAFALAHEFTHFVEEFSPAEFQKFADILFKESGLDANKLLERKREELAGDPANSKLNEQQMNDLAYSEMIAEAMETVFTDTDAIARISDQIRQQDKTLWEKIADFLKGLVEKLRKAYKGVDPDSRTAQEMRPILSTSEKILDAYVNAAVSAIEQYNTLSPTNEATAFDADGGREAMAAQKNNTPDGVKFSPRFAEEVSKIASATDKDTFDYERRFVGRTPKNLLDLGFANLPMTMGPKHIYLMVNKEGIFTGNDDHYHNLGEKIVSDLPEIISDPVITYVESYGEGNNSPTVVLVSNYLDADGKPILVFVRFSQATDFIDVEIRTNAISTAYGNKQNSVISKITEAYNEGRILQANKKSYLIQDGNPVPSSLWSQCPEALWKDSFADNIELFKQKVKRFLPTKKQAKKANNLYEEKTKAMKSSRNRMSPDGGLNSRRNAQLLSDEEVNEIQSIGRKSLNQFTSADIQATEKFARIYWNEMGVKSPFFRAWFGDWRANDNTHITVATKSGNSRGTVHNVDTGWNINVSGKVFSESQHRANKNTSAIPHLQNINDIVEKAVLLDSYSVGQLKSPNSLLMHSMYAVSDIGYGPELLKLYVEEMNDPNSVSTGKRAYQLQNIEKASAVAGGVQGTTPSSLATTTNAIRTVADLYASVKDKDSKFFSNSSSKIVNPDGTPMILYHQTSSDFTIFDPMHPGAGTRDNETPFGIFMKSSDKNIGLNGDKQMALYARIIHPLEVRDRQHLTRELKNISPDFSKISEEYRNLNFEYQRKADDAGEAVRAYMLEWRKEHPDASRREIYNDARYNQLSDAEDLLIDEWEEEAKKLENRSKDVITRDLEENGYDGVIILYDKGSFGRSTDTYIALHPEQVKSATDNIGTFDKSNPDIRYSSRNRMSEETKAAIDAYRAQQDALSKAQKALYNQERKEIVRAYQDKLKNLERSYSQEVADIQKAFFSLVRSYEAKADEAGASGQMVEELTEALKQEVKAHDIDRELWEQEFNKLKRDYEKSGRNIRDLEEKVKHQRETAKAKVESARKTEMRHKIQNTVNTLNRYLLNPTKDIHVPDSMQASVTLAMQAINGAVMSRKSASNEARLSGYYKQMSELQITPTSDAARIMAKRQELQEKIDRLTSQNANMKQALGKLRDAYKSLSEMGDPIYDEVVDQLLEDCYDRIGDTQYKDMSLEQLENIHDAYTAILSRIRKQNKAFREGATMRIDEMVQKYRREMNAREKRSSFTTKGTKAASQFWWNNTKPVYAFDRIGSSVLSDLYNGLRKGEDTWYRDVEAARAFYLGTAAKYNYDSWDFTRLYEFESATGKKFQLNLEELMSLYAYSLRDQARGHLINGGVVLNENTERTVVDKLGVKRNMVYNDANAYALTDETISEIRNALTPEQRAFAGEMQRYLSEVMGEKGNEISLKLYDIKLFREKNYWPLKSSIKFSERAKESQENPANKVKNYGFTKATVKNASNPVELSGFMETWAEHINGMSMYHAFTLPMEDFYRVYNWRGGYMQDQQSESTQSILEQVCGAGAVKYIDQFLRDLNGGLRADPRESFGKAMMSKFKKGAVYASASVAIQQPSAIGRAFAVISPAYFAGGKVEAADKTWEQLKKYAPVAGLKEMGRFDMDMGKSTEDYIMSNNRKLGEKVDAVLGWAPEMADRATWCAIWEAAKRQTASRNPSLKGDALLQKAGDLFTECITRTQVYDSVFSRSANMRSKSGMMNMVTAFMAEPTTSINMMDQAIRQFARGNKRAAARTAASVVTSVILNAMLVSFVYAARDKDEDKTYWEKYAAHFASGMYSGLNPLTYTPYVKDIWSLAQGYDIERSDMALYSDAVSSLNRWINAASKYSEDMTEQEQAEWEKSMVDAGWSSVDSVAAFFGIPVKNIRRDVNAALNMLKKSNWEDMSGNTVYMAVMDSLQDDTPIWNKIPRDKDADILYRAMISGDAVFARRRKSKYATAQKLDSAINSGLRQNDPRIKEAAQASIDGDNAHKIALSREILAEGNFTQNQIAKAINDEISRLEDLQKENKDWVETEQYFYTASDYIYAVINNIGSSDAMMREQVRARTENGIRKYGKTKEQAEKAAEEEFKSAISDEVREQYTSGRITDDQAVRVLKKAKAYSDDEYCEEVVRVWGIKNQIGTKSGWSNKRYIQWDESISRAGISMSQWESFIEDSKELHGEDKDGDGNTDAYSVMNAWFNYIDALPLSSAQKDALLATNQNYGPGTRSWAKRPWAK